MTYLDRGRNADQRDEKPDDDDQHSRLIDALQGRSEPRPAERAQLVAPIEKSHARREFQRATVFCDEHGVLRADPNPALGSHRLRAVGQANALIVVPDGPQRLAAGTVVEILRYA